MGQFLFLVIFNLCTLVVLGVPVHAQPPAYAKPTIEEPPAPNPSPSPSAVTDNKKSTKLIPLPIYSTLPNEGSTWGFMPVFLVVEEKDQRTNSIFAPSGSWNRTIGTTGTFRWFHYPSDTKSLTFTASKSSKVNWGSLFLWSDRPREKGSSTNEVYARVQRNIFFRFFGIGPDTLESNETSHTRIRGHFFVRPGFNVTRYFNVGLNVGVMREFVQDIAAPGLPPTRALYGNVPGMAGSTIASESLNLRYDTRTNFDYSEKGSYIEINVGPRQGISNSPSYGQVDFQAKTIVPEADWIFAGLRTYVGYVTSPNVPFYYQSTLGGSFLLRGFTENRFIDQGAWEVEMEQRIRLFQTRIYGVVADWRVDPFVAVGQVFGQNSGAFSNPRVAGGLGFRAFVQPNVLGRVDVGFAGEGPKFYVELGYPF